MSNNSISIRHNFPEVARKLLVLGDDIGNKALVRALNKTIEQGKTEMARGISKEFRISVGTAKDRLYVTRATSKAGSVRFEAKLEATRRSKGRSMNLIHFVTALPKKTKKGVTQVKFQVKRGGGRKSITGAFVGNQGRTLFIRTGKERKPIQALNTIDIPQMFNAQRINSVVRQVMLSRFKTNFDRELRVVLQGWVK
jgi:hypothetical protein